MTASNRTVWTSRIVRGFVASLGLALVLSAPATVHAQGIGPTFSVTVWDKGGNTDNGMATNVAWVQNPANTPLAGSPFTTDIIIEYWDSGETGLFGVDFPYPLLPDAPGRDNNGFVIRVTGWMFFPDTDPVTLGVNSDDGFRFAVDENDDGAFPGPAVQDGEVVFFHDGGRGAASSEMAYTPPRAGFLAFELLQWEGTGGASVEFYQVLDNGERVLVNDDLDTRSVRVFQTPNLDTGGNVVFLPEDTVNATTFDANRALTVAVPSDGAGNAAADNSVTVASDDTNIVDVIGSPLAFSAGGSQFQAVQIEFKAVGTATISLTNTAGLPVGAPVAVNVLAIDSLELTLPFDTMEINQTLQVSATGTFGAAGPIDVTAGRGTVYTSDPAGIVGISVGGLITPTAFGTVDITATNGTASDTKTLEVTPIRGKTFETRADATTEERSNGTLDFSSSDLELGDGQLVGLHWSGVDVPQGASILSAELVFTADEDNDQQPTDFLIGGQLSPNADVFVNVDFNVSARPDTAATVPWNNVAPWTPEDVSEKRGGPAQTTPDIASIVQEIVNQPGWQPGNSMVMSVDARTSPAKRVAESFASGPLTSVLLRIVFKPDPGFTPDLIVAATVDPPLTSTLTISPDCNLADDVTYSITSSDPGIASAAGPGTLAFLLRSEFFQDFEVAFTGTAGTTTLTAAAPPGSDDACVDVTVDVNVHAIDALTLGLPFAISNFEVGDTAQAIVTGSYGPAGPRDIAADSTGTTYSATPEGIVDISPDGLITAIAPGSVDITASNTPSDTITVIVSEQVTKIAFLAGGLRLNDADAAAVDHLRSLKFIDDPGQLDPAGLGPQVITFVGDNFNMFDENDIVANFDLLVISGTVSPGIVEARLSCTNIPVVFWGAGLNQNGHLSLTTTDGTTTPADFAAGGAGACAQGIFIVDAAHPITQGLATTTCVDGAGTTVQDYVGVYDTDQTFADADTTGLGSGARNLAENTFFDQGAIVVAGPAGDPDIPGGDGMRADGGVFLSRHVFLFLGGETFDDLTAAGQEVFDRSVDWALGGTRTSAEVTTLTVSASRTQLCPPDAALAAGSSSTQLVVTGTGGPGGCTPNLAAEATATTYEVNPAGVVEVSVDGLVTALAVGNATITATNNTISADISITVSLIDGVSGFFYEAWIQPGGVGNRVVENVQLTRTAAPVNSTVLEVINFVDGGCGSNIGDDTTYPFVSGSNFTVRATGLVLFPNTDTVTLRVNSDDGFVLFIDGEVVMFWDGGRGCGDSDAEYTPPRAGLLPLELIQWQGGGGAGVELVQLMNGDPTDQLLINDPVDTRSLRVFQEGCPETTIVAPAPTLVQVADGLGASPNEFISPHSESAPFTGISLEADEDVTLTSSTVESTDGTPRTATLSAGDGSGGHTLTIAPAVPVGGQVRVTLEVESAAGGAATFVVLLGHLPGDINQSGTVGISDVGQFGVQWRMIPQPAIMVDHNGDGTISASDPGAYGATFSGFLGSQQWNGLSMDELPAP